MKIEILGTGCKKCNDLEKATKEALAKIGGFHSLEKVDDLMKIMEYKVVNTPALVVDGKVLSTGKVLGVEEIVALISK